MCHCDSRGLLLDNDLKDSLTKEKENARKGLLISGGLRKENCFDMSAYSFLDGDPACPNTAHPNLWEQAKLNMNAGLFRVNNIEENEKADTAAKSSGGKFSVSTGDVFQIRGYDISNMTLLYANTGWIVMDVLTVAETAKAAWEQLVRVYLNDAPIKCIVYSHSHLDHYGGVGGIKDYFSVGCEIIAPEGFTKHAVSENIYVGTAIQRRAFYQFGHMLPIASDGQIDAGLGKVTAKGHSTLIAPTREIEFGDYKTDKNYAEIVVDNVVLHFQLTPGTEAPAEMNVYAPWYRVLFAAENCTGTLHNTLTPRGAQVRDALSWANYIDQAIMNFGDMIGVCSSHNWPHFGNADSIRYLELQRDLYRYIHNITLHLVNLGYTIDEVGRLLSDKIGMPKELADEWCAHGFYGTVNHNAKAVYQRYIGWYDGNPAHLNRNMPVVSATKYVEYMGGVASIMAKVKEETKLTAPNHAWIVEVLDRVMFADIKEDKKDAKTQLIQSLRALGYQSEGATWRNMYLTGAYELEGHLPDIGYMKIDDETINSMSFEMVLQLMGIMYDGCDGIPALENYFMNVKIIDSNVSMYVRVNRGVIQYGRMTLPDDIQMIRVMTDQIKFYRAFVDQDENYLSELFTTPASLQYARELVKHLIRFPINFPIMTPRSEYGSEGGKKDE